MSSSGEKLYNHFQKLSSDFYNKRKTGDLIAYAINDVSARRMTLGLTAMIINGFTLSSSVLYSMTKIMGLKFTFMMLIPIPFIVFYDKNRKACSKTI